ncbi:hypothetical protein UFOVP247_123 [uncultured Caudovirales phage]|uniref:Uncharacterized protein n=1 Tax=uncultured Caudovirales phage TaxID=2100421 RepID=A0A6J7WWR1_9CAUD|nr:hypothetical protein UFOVP247_123 [uncultured Caudovirales phage]
MLKIFSFLKESIEDENDENLLRFSKDIHTLILDKWFGGIWEDKSGAFKRSSVPAVAEIVNSLNPESVIDVGCGFNTYLPKIDAKKKVGIDPFNPAADVMQGVYEYHQSHPNEQYDVVLALGSINFGPRDKILAEVACVDALTKKGGTQVWRVNPNSGSEYNHKFPLFEFIEFFDWNKEFVEQIAEVYGYEIKEYEEEVNWEGRKRLFFVFYKY